MISAKHSKMVEMIDFFHKHPAKADICLVYRDGIMVKLVPLSDHELMSFVAYARMHNPQALAYYLEDLKTRHGSRPKALDPDESPLEEYESEEAAGTSS